MCTGTFTLRRLTLVVSFMCVILILAEYQKILGNNSTAMPLADEKLPIPKAIFKENIKDLLVVAIKDKNSGVNPEKPFKERNGPSAAEQDDTKIVLWHTKARYINLEPKLKKFKNCPYRCSFTTNKDYHNVSSALLFSAVLLPNIVPKRYKDQVFVVHNHEPQCTFFKNNPIYKFAWKNQVNWTMWYREDSDIHEPYGLIVKRENIPEKNFTQIFLNKAKMAVAMVSNCHGQSKRMEYIKKLRKLGVEIDIFGGCGNIPCPRGKDAECRVTINKKYKFFLAFENSFCPDYVTEKFFHSYNGDTIMVVRGGANYTKIAPRGTFINTQDYKSIKDVADYIIQLSKNKDDYVKILKRKNQYENLDEPYPHINNRGEPTYFTYHYEEKPMCDLCRKLWNINDYRKSYLDITSWLNKKNCFPAKDLN